MDTSSQKRPPQSRFLSNLKDKLFKRVVEDYWMRIEVLRQYEPRAVRWDRFPRARLAEGRLPRIAITTPSYNQDNFLEATLRSVLDQGYPRLNYSV